MSLNIEILLHPIRMRILQSFIPDKKLTASQIVESVPEISHASLYRHLSKLVEADALRVVEENRVRGTIEKVYKVNQLGISHEETENMSPQEHEKAFFMFLSHLLAEFQRYVYKENIDLYEDGVMYRQAAVYLDDDEFKDLLQSFNEIALKVLDKKPREGRKLRKITTIIIPE